MPAISVLISVYNVSPYIERCFDSILAQTFTDFEVIAVDNCSTDDSLKKLQAYAEKDSRITMIALPAYA